MLTGTVNYHKKDLQKMNWKNKSLQKDKPNFLLSDSTDIGLLGQYAINVSKHFQFLYLSWITLWALLCYSIGQPRTQSTSIHPGMTPQDNAPIKALTLELWPQALLPKEPRKQKSTCSLHLKEPGETQGHRTSSILLVSLYCCTWLAFELLSSFSHWWPACCSCYKFNHQV